MESNVMLCGTKSTRTLFAKEAFAPPPPPPAADALVCFLPSHPSVLLVGRHVQWAHNIILFVLAWYGGDH